MKGSNAVNRHRAIDNYYTKECQRFTTDIPETDHDSKDIITQRSQTLEYNTFRYPKIKEHITIQNKVPRNF